MNASFKTYHYLEYHKTILILALILQ